jgi:hypothetical protein
MFLVAVLDDSLADGSPITLFSFMVVAVFDWPFVAISGLLHHDPPAGFCWWFLLAVTGLFWGTIVEFIFVQKDARVA